MDLKDEVWVDIKGYDGRYKNMVNRKGYTFKEIKGGDAQ